MSTPTRPRNRWAGPIPRPRRRGRTLADCWRVFAAMVMIGSLASSIAFAPAAPALAAGQDCENGQVWDDSQQMCVDPTPDGGDQQMDATETPETVEPADVPTETPTVTPTPGPGTLSVYKYTCPAGYDFNQSGSNPASDCTTPTDGVSMTYNSQAQPNQQQTTANGGVATFSNLTPDSFTLSEATPDGTAATSWMCESAMQNPSYGTGTSLSGQIAGDEQLSCRFYNAPASTSTGLTIIVHKFECPAGYDASGQDANPESDCATQEQGVQFNISGSSTGYTSQSNTGDSVPGAVTFGGLEPDTYTITETLPAGTASAFVTYCTLSTSSNPNVPIYPTVTNGSIQEQFDDTATGFECYWYNVPSDTTVTPTATGTMSSDGITILVHKFQCPAGYDPSGQNANPETDCATPQDGVQFNIVNGDNTYKSQSNTGDSIPGSVMFGGLEPDTYTIGETPPAGTASAFVTQCVQTTTSGQSIPHYPTVEKVKTTLGIAYQFDQNDVQLECWWYNIPSDTTPTMTTTVTPTPTATSTEPSDLYIYKYECPAGYDPNGSGANPQYDCATPENGVQFNITGNTSGYTSQTNTGDSIPGAVQFGGIPVDTYSVVETLPSHVQGAFVTQCSVTDKNNNPLPDIYPVVSIASGKGSTNIVVPGGVIITCSWYNIPWAGSSDLTVHKQNCDVESYVDDSSCTPNTTGVTFEVYYRDGANWVLKASATTDSTGSLALSGLNPGTYKLVEIGGTWCNIAAIRQDGNGGTVSVLNSDSSFELVDGYETVVTVSNCTGGYGDITIYKWTCPPGYDYSKYGADPKADCTEATNGIQFNLAGQTKGYTSQSNTGDSIDGAVYFGGIPTDTYTVTETVPADTWYVFVWDCTGSSVNWVNPTPLNVGNVLNIKVANGDKIVCNWYNVPDPTSGDLTIYKEWCSGPKYVSDVDCTIYEKGMSFSVNAWNGTTWVPVTTQTTNNLGYIALSGLTPGKYQIVEQGGTPCNVTAIQMDPTTNKPVSVVNPDGSVTVTNGRETVVKVYNCTPKGGTPPPTKVPGKFPNTGVDPAASAGGSQLSAQDTQVIEPGTPQTAEAQGMSAAANGTPEANACPALTAADNANQSPLGTPQPDESCARGQVPASIAIPAIEVQATFEVKEIVGGELQEPSNESVVTWYKNSNRLGETGNIVVAGHLNYWGVPEAVFFKLGSLQQGDLITVTGADGGTYTYAVTSVQSVSIADGPAAYVAPTDKETLTLMTCGGEWDSSISEYDSRTVVTAVRVPNPGAAQAGG
ncbi:MAG: SpaA isopeptide-forming pilin-related protein [Thermomicrobiales bacterium]